MYHYIRPRDIEYPFFNSLDISIFKRQLDYFSKKYGFISVNEFIESINTGEVKKGVLLTFDDGFKDHYQYVLPELKKRHITGFFYIPTNHYKLKSPERKLLGVHRVHYLLGKYDAALLFNEIINMIDTSFLEVDKMSEFDTEIYKDQENSKSQYDFKRMFNYYIKYEHRDEILDSLMKKYFDETELYKLTYLDESEFIEIENEGNIVGSHTENHCVLSRLPFNEQLREIGDSFAFLESKLSMPVKSFCYPYGLSSSYNLETLDILRKLNVHHAFVVGNCEVNSKIIKNKFEITRIDCNRFLNI